MIDQIFEKINSLSEEAQNAAIQKATELKFDLNKGGVPLIESFSNLNLVRATLKDAIEKQKLVQLPITLQKELSEQFNNVARFLTGLAAGTDEVVNLTNAIEKLNTIVWQWGLHNLSDEFLGYQTKLNQVKQLEVELQNLRVELLKGLALKENLNIAVTQAEGSNNSLKETLAAAETSKKSAEENAKKVTEAQEKASASLTDINQKQVTSTTQSAKATESASAITAIEEKIKEFFKEIEAYKKTIGDTSTEAKTTVQTNNDDAKKLTVKLTEL